MWKSTDQYGTIYRKDGGSQQTVAVAKVERQGNTWPWAKAGIVFRNDLTSSGKTSAAAAGYALVAITPENGWVFQWDSDGDGRLDRTMNTGTTSTPSWVKLVRQKKRFTAYYSLDG